MNNAVFGKTMEKTEKRRNYLVSEPNYQIKVFHRKFISNGNGKDRDTSVSSRSVHLGLSILELSKILMYDFWYDYVTPKYCEKVKLYYVDTDKSRRYCIHKSRRYLQRYCRSCWN